MERLVFRGAYIRKENCVSKSAWAYTWKEICVLKSIGVAYSWKEIYVSSLQKGFTETRSRKRSHVGTLSRYGQRKSKPRVKTELRTT